MKAAIYNNGTWRLDYNGNRQWDGPSVDEEIAFGWAGAIPLVGDWNGDGKTKIGVVNQGFWFLDYDGNYVWNGGTTDKIAGWGPGRTPVPGKW
ncbi:MAG TPA: hypothetical protein PKJ41_15150 [Bryobacteraceae bacterium]|nr:hypothetical protein [Bryobacteraceae bacterium]HPT27741.1 hypothetical protein [Bryobacteraceae bacterium]